MHALSVQTKVASCTFYFFVNLTGRYSGNISLLRLSQRLHHRAMKIALTSLLDRQRYALFETSWIAGMGECDEELYVKLHDTLTASWEERLPLLASGTVILTMSIFMVPILLILNIVSPNISWNPVTTAFLTPLVPCLAVMPDRWILCYRVDSRHYLICHPHPHHRRCQHCGQQLPDHCCYRSLPLCAQGTPHDGSSCRSISADRPREGSEA